MTPTAATDATSDLPSAPDSSKPSAIHSPHHQALTRQVLHNLRYQHDWTSLSIHNQSPLTSVTADVPRPLISGFPPQRIYVHPDEQVEMLVRGVAEKDVAPEREWVLPAHVREKWSLRRLAAVFDAVGVVPPGEDGLTIGERADRELEGEGSEGVGNRRGGKRVLMAIAGNDSTVVYYIVHDGIVKPRQN